MNKNLEQFKLYTITDLANICGVTHRTAWQYVKDGKIKAHKIGTEWRITEENLKQFIGIK